MLLPRWCSRPANLPNYWPDTATRCSRKGVWCDLCHVYTVLNVRDVNKILSCFLAPKTQRKQNLKTLSIKWCASHHQINAYTAQLPFHFCCRIRIDFRSLICRWWCSNTSRTKTCSRSFMQRCWPNVWSIRTVLVMMPRPAWSPNWRCRWFSSRSRSVNDP